MTRASGLPFSAVFDSSILKAFNGAKGYNETRISSRVLWGRRHDWSSPIQVFLVMLFEVVEAAVSARAPDGSAKHPRSVQPSVRGSLTAWNVAFSE